jgi:hypothetical protein
LGSATSLILKGWWIQSADQSRGLVTYAIITGKPARRPAPGLQQIRQALPNLLPSLGPVIGWLIGWCWSPAEDRPSLERILRRFKLNDWNLQ